MSATPAYADSFISVPELVWGNGYLSPGGPDEVHEILPPVTVTGKSVLDIGCGIAGPAISIVKDLQASRVTGVDVEPHIARRQMQNVFAAGCADAIDIVTVSPGVWPFEAEMFDLAFGKESFLHIADKQALYRSIHLLLNYRGNWCSVTGLSPTTQMRFQSTISIWKWYQRTYAGKQSLTLPTICSGLVSAVSGIRIDARPAWLMPDVN